MKLIINSALLLGLFHSAAGQCASQIVLALAAATEDYTILTSAVGAAGISGALVPPLTLLAPTDAAFKAAFAELGFETDKLGEVPVGYLLDVLQFHLNPTISQGSTQLTSGLWPTAFIAEGETAPENLVVVVGALKITFDTATVIEADILLTDCAVHGIDELLLPYTPPIPCEVEAISLYDCASASTVCQEVKDLFADPGFGNDAPIETLPTCTALSGEYCNCLGCSKQYNAFLTCINTEYAGECKAPVCDSSASGIIMSFFSMAIVVVAAYVGL